MNIVRKEMEKQFNQGFEMARSNIRKELIEAIREGEPERVIKRLINAGKFTDEEVKEIVEEAKRE